MNAQMTYVPKKYHVLNVAHDLFKKYGFHTVGVDRIIADSKVAKMTFYNNFRSKNNLIFAIVEREISDQKSSLENALNDTAECESVGQLKALFDWHLSFIKQKNYSGCLLNKALVELWSNSEIIKLIEDFNNWKFELVLSYFDKNNKSKAILFFNLLNGMLLPANKNIIEWADLEKII
ncbi:TetR/AcrR family transcriptional regulator [Acinetobacter nosocomialis]|uniref:TetR/AcrR family transcriptional regulator n=1 Tax=Acinetobacter nosocomialis TaxID=106654 RepID=UPI001F47CE1E|nr:TetR/AcrR family transcriptional regulator [Acinetobacter nosocomialis]MCE7534221.1 TetR/AcrR family transcriptional regulator [Acinetobacter nosocomialis]